MYFWDYTGQTSLKTSNAGKEKQEVIVVSPSLALHFCNPQPYSKSWLCCVQKVSDCHLGSTLIAALFLEILLCWDNDNLDIRAQAGFSSQVVSGNMQGQLEYVSQWKLQTTRALWIDWWITDRVTHAYRQTDSPLAFALLHSAHLPGLQSQFDRQLPNKRCSLFHHRFPACSRELIWYKEELDLSCRNE